MRFSTGQERLTCMPCVKTIQLKLTKNVSSLNFDQFILPVKRWLSFPFKVLLVVPSIDLGETKVSVFPGASQGLTRNGTWYSWSGSFENEALENEDRSTKHPNLENEAPETRKRSTYRKRSTQISKTKHPKLETTVGWIKLQFYV